METSRAARRGGAGAGWGAGGVERDCFLGLSGGEEGLFFWRARWKILYYSVAFCLSSRGETTKKGKGKSK